MLNLKFSAAIAVVFFMSSISAQAMEFADRPGPVSGAFNSSSTVRTIASEDRSRRQINNHLILLPVTATGRKLADRSRPVSNLIRIQVARMMFERPGRLSAEFSAVARGSGIRFEYGPGMASAWVKPMAMPTAVKLKHRPALISDSVKASVAEIIKFEDCPSFTSSLTQASTALQLNTGSAEFCTGSIAPCDLVRFYSAAAAVSISAMPGEPSELLSLSSPF